VVGADFDDTGASNAGSAYVYDLSSGTPTVPVAILNNPGPGVGENFGSSVAVDGTTVAIGTPLENTVPNNKGAAYVFGPASNDTDGDGLLDIWEYANFGSVAARNANDDLDGDGLSELMEQAFNTNPSKADGPNAIPQVVSEGGFLTLTVNKRAGVNYSIESAGGLDIGMFSPATTTILTNNATTLKARDNFTPTTATQRFLRVKVTAAP
jgi:FG-GAP repeat/Bacterial TSP3 repeat